MMAHTFAKPSIIAIGESSGGVGSPTLINAASSACSNSTSGVTTDPFLQCSTRAAVSAKSPIFSRDGTCPGRTCTPSNNSPHERFEPTHLPRILGSARQDLVLPGGNQSEPVTKRPIIVRDTSPQPSELPHMCVAGTARIPPSARVAWSRWEIHELLVREASAMAGH